MDRSYFIGSFQLLSGGLTSTIAIDWHLKVKNKKCDACLIKNYCIITSKSACKKSAQSINSFSRF